MALVLGLDCGSAACGGVLFDEEKGGIVGRAKVPAEGEKSRAVAGLLRRFPPAVLGRVERAAVAVTWGLEEQREMPASSLAEAAAAYRKAIAAPLAAAGLSVPIGLYRPEGGCPLTAGTFGDFFRSGPLAALAGAIALSGEEGGYGMDIGAFSTRLGALQGEEDFPALLPVGADSPIYITGQTEIAFGPGPALPLHRGGGGLLAALAENPGDWHGLLRDGYPFGLMALGPFDGPLFEALQAGPAPTTALAAQGLLPSRAGLEPLFLAGVLRPLALTPSDLFHVNGGYVAGSREAAFLGAERMGEVFDLAPLAFAQYGLDRLAGEIADGLRRHLPGLYGEEKPPLLVLGAAAGSWLRFLGFQRGLRAVEVRCGEVAPAVSAACQASPRG